MLASATRESFCALVDATDTFDPKSAEAGGVNLWRLLWVRCDGPGMTALEQAFKSADLLLQGSGGFGFVVVDLGRVAEKFVRRVPLSTWFRFRGVVERLSTALVFVTPQPALGTCSSLTLHLSGAQIQWSQPTSGSLEHARFPNAVDFQIQVATRRSLKKASESVRGFSAQRRWAYRGADLLSGLIPRIYLDFVRGGPPERLIPVFHHNQMDLRGLAALSSRILSLLSDAETQGQDGLELFGVSRICERRGDGARARKLYEKSIASVLPAETDRAARRSLARLAKRDGDFAVACELWKNALGNSRQGYEAYEQLAIYHEHRGRDPQQAREVVRQALDELRQANHAGTITPRAYREINARFEHRMARLERKSRPPLLDALVAGARPEW